MKIYCDYCGTQIDTDTNITCPHCGASYANDDELKTEQKRQERQLLLGDFDDKMKQLKEQEIMREFENHRKEANLAIIGKVIVGAVIAGITLYAIIRIGIALN
ncbi:MAG: zinc ribbon domain-containing protein [Ruminiclostridium sp.]|nr:zinc ribbon domain-containing protein [Ruminiclostridium sp.]